ncbi:TetR/AcrR family transcriptional regulator [Streptomyces sp. NPDC056672]|uniref:TetR/AcrR family transcriptional regulator n=1 Tax=Streptomyces sp. NPDC056672 TaxID=3345906 RepID=UPI00369E0753
MNIDEAAPDAAPETGEPTVEDSQRERLLNAAVDLFYSHGVDVPASALCKRAGISKKSMYQLYESKDALFVAALERRILADSAFLLPPPGFGPSPRARLLHVFHQLEAFARTPEYMGCAFLAPQVQLMDPAHPTSIAAARIKREHLEGFFHTEAVRGNATDPDFLTRQLITLYDGASTRAGIGADNLEGLAVTTADTLIQAAGVTA